MTRHVFTNDQCIHVWAQGCQEYGRGHGNVHFDGFKLYSYGALIGRIVLDKQGNTVGLISDHKWSAPTTQHQLSAMRAFASDSAFWVASLGETYWDDGLTETHAANVRAMVKAALENVAKAMRKRDDYPSLRGNSLYPLKLAKRYAERFGVSGIELPDEEVLWRPVEERFARLNSPEAQAKREAAAGRRALTAGARHEAEIRRYRAGELVAIRGWRYCAGELVSIRGFSAEDDEVHKRARRELIKDEIAAQLADPDCIAPLYSIDRYLTDEERAVFTARGEARNQALIAEWRAGRRTPPPRGDSALLRLSGDVIETSWGASFPTEHGIKALPLIRRLRQRGGHTFPWGTGPHLGHFRIDSIDSAGTIHAGCHVVRYEEVEAIARQLGLAED